MLEAEGLESHAVALAKANVSSVAALAKHSVEELEESLQRSTVYGKKFAFSAREKRVFAGLCNVSLAQPRNDDSYDGDSDADDETKLEKGLDFTAAFKPKRKKEDSGAGVIGDDAGGAKSSSASDGFSGGAEDLLDGCAYASMLIGSAVPGLSAPMLADMVERLALASSSPSSMPKPGAELDALVDLLDALLSELVHSKVVEVAEIAPAASGVRAAKRKAHELAMAIEKRLAAKAKTLESKTDEESGTLSAFAKVITATTAPRLSAADEKVAEELAASSTRLQTVAKDPKTMRALKCLSELVEGKQSAIEKLTHYSTVATEFPEVDMLLKSSHVKEPRGELLTSCPEADECVTLVRVARNGVRAAAKELFRRYLPPHVGDATPLVEAAFGGILVGEAACTVSHLAKPDKAKPWLGLQAAGASDKGAGSQAKLLIVQLKALPLLGHALMLLQPADTTVPMTWMELMSGFARGVSVRSVGECVDGLLVPVMRAYAEAVDAFQKSATAPFPSLADVWAKERQAPTVMAFLANIGTAEAGSSSASSAAPASAETSTALKEANKRIAALEKKQKGMAAKLSDVESGDEDEQPKLSKKAKKKAAKADTARKDAAAAAEAEKISAGGAAPSAAAPKRNGA